ncbi:MAG: CotH kinase family protein [Treponema sp.]|nr:CotH kinase family protein [Treponema sp.]
MKNKVCIFLFFCIFLVFISCNNSNSEEYETSTENATIKLRTSSGKEYTPFFINKSGFHFSVSNDEDLSNMQSIIIDTHGNEKCYDCADYSNFCVPVEVEDPFVSINPEKKKIIIYDLPILMINTPDGQPIMSKEIRVEDCDVNLITFNGKQELGKAGIKGRGNSTWLQEKKPYNIKFDEKQSILGMKSSKKWVLLANAYYDRTQLHNATAFEIARLTDYEWVQSGQFVELILNGEHKGLYYLCEKIDIEKEKINIDKLKEKDLDKDKITGGYLLEIDNTSLDKNPVENYSFVTDYFNKTTTTPWYPTLSKLYWILKEPEENVPNEQFLYIQSHINNVESLLYSDNNLEAHDYEQYLDLDSIINWWFVEEIALNEEAARSKNLYIYKKRGDNKLYFGPPWDLDAWTFGIRGTKRFFAKPSFYYAQLFKDPSFVNKVKEKWLEYKPIWEERIPLFIEEQYELIHRAAERNETMWTDWNPVNNYETKTYEQLIKDMKNSFFIQLEWMDSEIKNL